MSNITEVRNKISRLKVHGVEFTLFRNLIGASRQKFSYFINGLDNIKDDELVVLEQFSSELTRVIEKYFSNSNSVTLVPNSSSELEFSNSDSKFSNSDSESEFRRCHRR